ncbi:MAG: sensor histidine kinase [Rubrivivax sp.]|nr:MAG: sensor histidine kinase [Rubrivivax sp.]
MPRALPTLGSMSFSEEFAQALRHHRMLMKHRPDRARYRLLIYGLWSLGFGVGFAIFSGVQRGSLGSPDWWRNQLPANLLVSVCVTACFFVAFRGFERMAPQRWLDKITGWHDWRSALFFSGMSIACAAIGILVGLSFVDWLWQAQSLRWALGNRGFWLQFLIISVLISLGLGLRYRARWKQEVMQARVTEAQLRLLQGQIEPHFLFNTLANVQSLIDFDPERAKQMLERFTDYLRASLGQLRGDSTTLAQEFAMLEAYLGLMQLRMGQRLSVRLDLPDELSGFELPPLLLQPLVENAIHHGLEPKIEGGEIIVSARREAGGLLLDIEDDGQGLDGPRRRPGNGVALDNIRARLAARWGPTATLSLQPRDGGGTRSRISIPTP